MNDEATASLDRMIALMWRRGMDTKDMSIRIAVKEHIIASRLATLRDDMRLTR